jgi:hypothetical protein
MRRGILAVAALLTLVACQRAEPPRPSPPAPERPVVTLAAKPGERVQIPRAALVERAGVPGVFVLNENNVARFRMLRLGKVAGDRVEVLAGLTGNERLVLGDLHEVRDGSPIRPKSP